MKFCLCNCALKKHKIRAREHKSSTYHLNHLTNCTFFICLSCGIESKALTWLADISDGDARIALGNLELVVQHKYDANTVISVDDIKEEIKVGFAAKINKFVSTNKH